MKAIAIYPRQPNTAHLAELPMPAVGDVPNERGVLIKILQVGVDGTDKELIAGEYGGAPPGYDFLVTGHESFGKVVEVGPNVRDLAPGRYDLAIDGQKVGTYTSGQLAFGVELEANEKTPQYQQALKVALLNKERNDKAVHPLRDQWGQLKGRRRNLNKAEQEKASNAATLKADLETYEGLMAQEEYGVVIDLFARLLDRERRRTARWQRRKA